MRHKLRRFFLNVLNDTPLEGFARQIYATISQDKGTQYDRETRKVMRKALTATSNCIDVGAYRGEILREMLAVCPRGTIFAIEPIPENHAYDLLDTMSCFDCTPCFDFLQRLKNVSWF